VAGVDGCRGGWLAVEQGVDGNLAAFVSPTAVALLARLARASCIAVDIPIGLPEAGSRACDLEARSLLSTRRKASVFPAPLRACLGAVEYQDACAIRQRIEGKKMSRQAFNLIAKIREMDELLRRDRSAGRCVFEAHPELSFALWNHGQAMTHNKKQPAGRLERRALIESRWPEAVARLREELRGEHYALDDLHDALAALWSACRRSQGREIVLGAAQAVDRRGLPMRIIA
jgi:predicted RNase H-like nuclease